MDDKKMSENAEGLVDVGRLVLKFAKVNRVTFHEDGERSESGTDHTVMVSICACALAKKLYPNDLDIGLVSQFATIHDLVEAYADDTDSFGIAEEARMEKEKKETEAFHRIEKEFKDIFPWIPDMIEKYEKLDTREARFVKTVDKCMTKVTHILNGGAYFKKRGLNRDEMWDNYQKMARYAEVRYGSEFPEIIDLIDELIEKTRVKSYGN